MGYYGAYIGDDTDGSTNGLTLGPSNVQFIAGTWSTLVRTPFEWMHKAPSEILFPWATGFPATVANNFEGYDQNNGNEVPVIEFSADECASKFDYFERSDLRSTSYVPLKDVDGVA
jgi:hypothetical protein